MKAALAYLEAPLRYFSGGQRKTTNKARLVFVPTYIQTKDFQNVNQKFCL
jgi:hypothetical protein